MANCYYKNYMHIFFSEEISLICPNLNFLIVSFQPTICRHVFRMQLPKLDCSRDNPVIAIRKCEGENQIGRESQQTQTSLRHQK